MKPLIGGQAVIEGVMMKGPKHYSVSVRKPNGDIITKVKSLKKHRFKLFKLPIIRGFVSMIDMLTIGIQSILWSSNQQEDEDIFEMSWKDYLLLGVTSIGLAIGLFIILPLILTNLITSTQGIYFNIIDGILRILIFVSYLTLMGQFKDMKTLFAYHGAEHKAVNCYESNEKLTINNAKKYSTLHPRCGTSFILIVLTLSIALFSIIHSNVWYIKFLTRIIFIPIIAGISFELLQLSAKLKNNKIINSFILPGLWLQKLTTNEPNENQLEIAIEALKHVINRTKNSN